MGNAALVCGGRSGLEARSPVTVLQADGNVLTLFGTRVRVVDLILDYPNHFVCHSSSIILLQQGKILPLHTLLVPGEVYFLLPMPLRPDHDNESDTSSLLHIEPPRRAVQRTGSTKFVISTEQFAKIMARTAVKEGRAGGHGVSLSTVKRKRQSARGSKATAKSSSSSSSSSSSNHAPMAPWRPALSSIEEVAAN